MSLVRSNLILTVTGIGLLTITISKYLDSFNYLYFPLIFIFLTSIITGLFELKEYYYKTFYLISIILSITVMWAIIYIQLAPPIVDKPIFYLITILTTLFIIIVTIFTVKRGKEFQKALEPYEKALKLNPNDTTALNNKAVKLTHQNKQEHAMKIFDQILKTDPQDPAALHNKGALLDKKGKPTQAKKIPKLLMEDVGSSPYIFNLA